MRLFFQIISLFVLILSASPAFSSNIQKQDITVGSEPMGIYSDAQKGIVHVICNGYDKNFNGMFEPDSGDAKPSWWIIENIGGQYKAKMVRQFEMASIKFPLRPAFSSYDRKIYINHVNKVVPYDLDSYAPIESSVLAVDASGVAKNGNFIFLCTNEVFGQPGALKIFNTQNEMLQIVPGKLNTQEVVTYPTSKGNLGLVVLSQGKYSSDSSIVQIGEYDFKTLPVMTDFVVGKTANHLASNFDQVAVTVNGSHKVIVFNTATREIAYTINTGTTGWDGPRETTFVPGGMIYVSTYNGDVRKYDLLKGTMIDSIGVHGKPDGLTYVPKESKGVLFVANSVNADYSPDSTVTIIEELPVSVDDETITKEISAKIFPNPASNFIKIDGISAWNSTVEVYNLTGMKLLTSVIDGSDINVSGLENGCYYAKIKSGNRELILPIRIAR